MFETLRRGTSWIASRVDGRDLLGLAGVGLLLHGGELLHRGAGFAAAGVTLILIAVLVR